jgi:hypothetical protein
MRYPLTEAEGLADKDDLHRGAAIHAYRPDAALTGAEGQAAISTRAPRAVKIIKNAYKN